MKTFDFIKQKIELLSKTTWQLADIQTYFGLSKSAATNLKREILLKTPKLKINKEKAHTVISVEETLKYHGTSRIQEITLLKEAYKLLKEVKI